VTSAAILTAMLRLAFALLATSTLFAQGPSGDPTQPPKGLTVVFVNVVSWGDGTIIIGPTGKVMVFDAGYPQMGTRAMLPKLKALGATKIDWFVASHYHSDHIGGIPEVINAMPTTEVWDRGTRSAPSNSSYQKYTAAAQNKRKTVTPGQVFDLGGGAKATVIARDGFVLGVGQQKITGTGNYENSASIVLKVEYGDFSLWLGGDLTGGAKNKTYDMESPVAKACGDIDVYHANHHGISDATNANLVRYLSPEVAVVSVPNNNSQQSPQKDVLSRLTSGGRSPLILSTNGGLRHRGYTNARGHLTLKTDGWRYRIETVTGESVELYTDEASGNRPGPGDLVISELHRTPSTSSGEFIEVFNRSGGPLNLDGLIITSGSGSFTVTAPYRILPGQRLLLAQDGDSTSNGGIPFSHTWPSGAFALNNTKDSLSLRNNAGSIETLSYSTGFPGSSGKTAERIDLEAPPTAANFKTAVTSFGTAGDKGTPGKANAADATTHPIRAGIETLEATDPGGIALHLFAAGLSNKNTNHAIGMSFGSSPGIRIGPTSIPLNYDPLLGLSLELPGFVGVIGTTGLRGLRLPLPKVKRLKGTPGYLAHFLLDLKGPVAVPASSKAVRFIFP